MPPPQTTRSFNAGVAHGDGGGKRLLGVDGAGHGAALFARVAAAARKFAAGCLQKAGRFRYLGGTKGLPEPSGMTTPSTTLLADKNALRTRDLGGKANTVESGEAITAAV